MSRHAEELAKHHKTIGGIVTATRKQNSQSVAAHQLDAMLKFCELLEAELTFHVKLNRNLRERIMKNQKILAAAETKIISLQNDLAKAQADVQTSQQTIDSQKTTIDTLNGQIDELKKADINDAGDIAEFGKLAGVLNLDPTTGDPLPTVQG